MPKKKPETDRVVLNRLKKEMLESGDPLFQEMAPHIHGAMKIVNYAVDVLDAGKKAKAPRGIGVKLASVELTATDCSNPKLVAEVKCAVWILDTVGEYVKNQPR